MKTATMTFDGKTIGFVAREVKTGTEDCEGCLFCKRPAAVCREAERAAQDAGQPDCDDKAPSGGSYIYVEADPRQLVLVDEHCPRCGGTGHSPEDCKWPIAAP